MNGREETLGSVLSVDERIYQQDILQILFRWSAAVTLAMGVFYLVLFWQKPMMATLTLGLAFSTFPLVVGWCLHLLQRQREILAVRVFMIIASLLVALFILFMPDKLVLIGMMGLFLLVRIVTVLETPLVILLLGGMGAVLYLSMVTLRQWLNIPQIELGVFDGFFWEALPVLILMIFIFLDRAVTLHLKKALFRSEVARNELTHSYTQLEQHKTKLEQSELSLSTLAVKLHQSNQELQATNEELKSFTFIVSHDLRAPLINLKGFAGELRFGLAALHPVIETILPQLNGKQKSEVSQAFQDDIPEAMNFIDASVTRMDTLISAILKLSRLGHRELDFEWVDMNELVQTMLQTLAHQIEQGQVNIKVGPLPQVKADRTSLEQIMGNILVNAVAYLDPTRPGQIEISSEMRPEETIFHVRDNGCGIAVKDMAKVFMPFRRAGEPNVPGEGMGLAYVQTLVRRHGGQIWCQSQLGVGTTFSFTLANHLMEGDG